ncbi:MAG: alpha-methylacyl-CoA racemase [Gammaproteobacteria bacterium]|jgi:alpha-methylacyl-CoA racemase
MQMNDEKTPGAMDSSVDTGERSSRFSEGVKLGDFLRGVRVLDLSHYISGPLASLTLADMGADVLKIEPPSGDGMQRLGPRDVHGHGLFYAAINAGKSVLKLNLKDDGDRQRFLALSAEADVVIEGFRPGVMSRLGIDYAVLRSVNSALVFCSIGGYGANTSLAARAGHDANYLAEAGVLDRNGHERPVYFDPPIADATGGLYAALAILGALNARNRTGEGTCIELALADAIMPLQQFQIAEYGASGFVPGRGQTYLNGGAAYYNVYRTCDQQYVVIGAVEKKFWQAFCVAADRREWIARQDDPIPQTALMADVAAHFANLTLDACDALFADVDCCYSKVAALDTAMSSPYVNERELVRRSAERHLQALFPAWVGGEPPTTREPFRELDAIRTDTGWRN